MTGVNEDTDASSSPRCELGHVVRDIIWRIQYLWQRFRRGVRIVPIKIDVKDAFREVPVEITRAPVFGYVFGDFVVVNRRLHFGWRNSQGFWCSFASALEHVHNNTSRRRAVYTDSGREAIQHVVVTPSRESRAAALPPGYVAPPRRGGSADYFFFVRFYVDDGVSVEVQCYPSGDRCLCASASLASDHFRSFGYRAPTAPPLLSKHNFCHWDTQLAVLGWEIDSVAMNISLTKAKVAKLRGLLFKWPRGRPYALESELRELVGNLLYDSEVVRPGK